MLSIPHIVASASEKAPRPLPRRASLRFRLNATPIGLLALLLALPATAQTGAPFTGRLIVKFKDSGAKSLVPMPARLKQLAVGTPMTLRHVRPMAGGAHVVGVEGAATGQAVEALANELARDPEIEYAEPERVRKPALIPNDEFLPAQTYLFNEPTGIDAFAAWDVTTGSSRTIIAILDTGIRPHVAMARRVLPGYDFVSDATRANDGDGRDADASDPGDWATAADRAGPFPNCDIDSSSWHGTLVSGVIAANGNDGRWTTGLNWAAKILPVRVLGKCGGTDSDIIDAIAWAAGLPVPGVPTNPTPAHVINLSLGGEGACLNGYRATMRAALARGFTRAIVVAAGNDDAEVAKYLPANCPDVIAVASTSSTGDKARYSNFGTGIAVSAPGGQYSRRLATDGVLTLSNAGTTTPTRDTVANVGGSSFAAPMVSGVISLMLDAAPNLTAVQVRSILVATAKPFIAGSNCNLSICGAGLLDADAAVRGALAAAGATGTASVIEFYHRAFDHYFISADALEIARLDGGATMGWVRTGRSFKAHPSPRNGASAVCRFYIPPQLGDSHFFGRGTDECAATAQKNSSFVHESPAVMHLFLPSAGNCPATTLPVYRVFSARADANHRYTTDPAVRDDMIASGWLAEGDGPDRVVLCAPE